MTDEEYMQMALDLAEKARGATSPNPLVGCVIVSPDGHVVGKGYHHKAGEPHAEINAMDDAGREDCRRYGLCDFGALFPLWQDGSLL